MAQLFISRPVLAWVFAFFIAIAGLIVLPMLPVSQYPKVAPPQLTISTTYPGASPQEMYQGVTRQIEEELNGVKGVLYFESTSNSTGSVNINVTFQAGTDINQAAVEVQNALRRVEPRLPSAVRTQGINVEEASAGFLMFVSLTSSDKDRDDVALGDYISRNVIGELRRIPGVGRAQLFGGQRALRVWVDPAKMVGLNITSEDINSAIAAQNAQVAAGQIGAQPNPVSQDLTATVLVEGQLTTAKQFGGIILRANPDGSAVRLSDVAKIEEGSDAYNLTSRLNGKASASLAIQLSSTGNALAVSNAVKEKMEELSRFFPAGVEYSIPYDTSPFVSASITKVVMTLVEAMVLVFLVMFVFLQNIRYTLIPTLVVPIALLGTFAVMHVVGFSINVLTMFAMVLAIGILVDDAIVVVENVEHIMAKEGLAPKEATRKAMRQITGAVVGMTLVLACVFVPMAFFPGSTGVIYRQFSLTMIVSILFSAFLAMSLTPALCATFLKPIAPGHAEKKGLGGWFNRRFDRVTDGYAKGVAGVVKRSGRVMIFYVALVAGLGYLFVSWPSSFVPEEDQGYLMVDVQGPPEASANRTFDSLRKIEAIFAGESAVKDVLAIQGFSFSGNGPNAGLVFVTLKDWSERGDNNSVQQVADRANAKFFELQDATVFALSPPPIDGFGTTAGFSFRLQDRGNNGQAELTKASNQLLEQAAKSKIVVFVRTEGLPDAAQVQLIIDREKANTFGVTFADINNAITTNLGSSYINDYPNAGRMQRVIVQAQDRARLQIEDVLKINVRNAKGGMVPLSAVAIADWRKGPPQIIGYNGYPSSRISGMPDFGQSSGAAITEMERIAADLPKGFSFQWTGQSLEEIAAGSQAPMLFGLSILFVFLLLAGLYESWSIPLAVMLVVPLGVIGSLLAIMLRFMPNDIYFKVGLVAIIGLSAKNAILIVEFAKEYYADGKSLMESAIAAARARFRPIVMTSLAFTLGVVPLAIATGPSAASQNAIGTGVLGGMISATVLAVFFVPAFFVFVLKLLRTKRPVSKSAAAEQGAPDDHGAHAAAAVQPSPEAH